MPPSRLPYGRRAPVGSTAPPRPPPLRLVRVPPRRARIGSRPARRMRGSCRRRGTRPRGAPSASGFSRRRWIARLSGRAPYAGSQPASAISSRAPLVGSRVIPRSARRSLSRRSCSSTISASCSRLRASNTTISSIRLRNSGRKRSASSSAERMFEGHDHDGVAEVDGAAVPVGQAAVVEQLEEDVEHLGVRLLDLVEQDHGVRAPTDRLGQLPALLVAHVARGRTHEPADRCASPGTRTCRVGRSRGRRRT